LKAAVVGICIVLVAPRALADQTIGSTTIAVTATGARAETCPDEPTFVAAVARMMHRDAAANVGRIVVEMRAERDRVEGSITTSEPGGTVTMQRKLHGKECHDVSEGLALIVALTIDPLADPSLPAIAPETPKVETPPPPPPPPPRIQKPTQAAPREEERTTKFYGALVTGARMTWGVAPLDTIGLAIGAQFGMERGRWAPSVRIEGGPLGNASVQAGTGTVVVSGGEIGALICPATFTLGSRVVVGGCVSGGATIVVTRSIGYTVSHDTTTPVGHLGVALALHAQITGPLGVFFDAGLRFPLESIAWEVDAVGPIGRTSPVAGTAALGLDFSIR
jgi:hypothetical protein